MAAWAISLVSPVGEISLGGFLVRMASLRMAQTENARKAMPVPKLQAGF
jgi:hypothetical protein